MILDRIPGSNGCEENSRYFGRIPGISMWKFPKIRELMGSPSSESLIIRTPTKRTCDLQNSHVGSDLGPLDQTVESQTQQNHATSH